jgi:surface antigen
MTMARTTVKPNRRHGGSRHADRNGSVMPGFMSAIIPGRAKHHHGEHTQALTPAIASGSPAIPGSMRRAHHRHAVATRLTPAVAAVPGGIRVRRRHAHMATGSKHSAAVVRDRRPLAWIIAGIALAPVFALAGHDAAAGHAGTDTGATVVARSARSFTVSRDEYRVIPWSLGDSSVIDPERLTREVGPLERTPAGFDPNHDTGDTGNAYPWSECTWWAYVRRHQLHLPVGSYLGNGADWAASARRLGYWVDGTPRSPGDVMVFAAGQDGSSVDYGHVAIVEKINDDGTVLISECGSAYQGVTHYRTVSPANHSFIHL